MDGFKKIIPTELKELINLKPEGKYLFVSMAIIENPHTAIDPYCNEKIEIEFQCTNAPQGILLKVFCIPTKNSIHILKWAQMSPDEKNALHLDIYKHQRREKKEDNDLNNAYMEYEDSEIDKAYTEYEDDMECSMALEVSYN